MIYTLTMNPALDKTAEVEMVKIGGLNRLNNVIVDAGGKGINVSKTLKSLEKDSKCFGVIAGSNGEFIINELDRLQIQHDFLKVKGNTRTNLKIVDKESTLSEFNENGPSPSDEEQKLLKEKIGQRLEDKDILIISGSVPLGVPKSFYYEIIKNAKMKGACVILDADGELFSEGIKALPDIIKPNRYELAQYFNANEDMDDQTLIKYAKKWIMQGIKLVVVSMGQEGAYFICENKVIKALPLKVKVHSSVGAGDAMVAALAYALEEEMELEEMARWCSACGTGAAVSMGTKPATLKKVKELKKQVVLQV